MILILFMIINLEIIIIEKPYQVDGRMITEASGNVLIEIVKSIAKAKVLFYIV